MSSGIVGLKLDPGTDFCFVISLSPSRQISTWFLELGHEWFIPQNINSYTARSDSIDKVNKRGKIRIMY